MNDNDSNGKLRPNNQSKSKLLWRVAVSCLVLIAIVPAGCILFSFLKFWAPLLTYELLVPYMSDPVTSPRETTNSIGVVIRSYKNNIPHTLALLWDLEAQNVLLSDVDPVTIEVIIAPTESDSVQPLKDAIGMHWNSQSHPIAVTILQPKLEQFQEWSQVLPTLCTDGWYKQTDAIVAARVCNHDNPTHYEITDIAIDHLLKMNPKLRYLLVTNGDNYYGPSFLSDAIELFDYDRDNGKTKYDCILTYMVHHRRVRKVRPWMGKVDLGASVWRVDYMLAKDMISFVSVLKRRYKDQIGPGFVGPSAKDYYEADGKFVEEAILHYDARVGTVTDVNFVHT